MHLKELNRLAKFIAYVLGRHPDEFGLLPDSQGFVSIKEFLKAVNEESGWRNIRKGQLNELCITLSSPSIEIVANLIRAVDRGQLPTILKIDDYPKLLYCCIRTKAYPIVLDKGVKPRQGQYVILAKDPDMALRIGRRIDSSPILLTVNVNQCLQADIEISAFGQHLFVAPQILAGCFSGPALPKEKPEKKESKQPVQPKTPPAPGSFFPDFDHIDSNLKGRKGTKGRKEKGWKEARKKDRRRQNKGWD